jgi:hypothetical protein
VLVEPPVDHAPVLDALLNQADVQVEDVNQDQQLGFCESFRAIS